MREIKFRCWDKEKEMWTNYAILDGAIKCMDKNTGVWFADNDRFLIQQYTGLHDKNGKEICEGDILHLTGKDTLREYNWKAIVAFGNPNGLYNWGFQLKPITEFEFNTDILLWVEMEEVGVFCEIIGNFYEDYKK